MAIYTVNNQPTIQKIKEYNEQDNVYFRFQNSEWEMGEKSWGMIFDSEEDAIENCEEWGMTPEEAILDGKSACYTSTQALNFASNFDKEFVVLVLKGSYVQDGHDEEPVIDVKEILEVWDYNEFCKVAFEI